MKTLSTPSTLIIGAGLAGLVAALRLARAGRAVTVLEASQHLGGRARTLVRGEYRLNLGPHALYRGGAAMRSFRELGVPVAGAPAPVQGAVAWRGGRAHTLPVGFVSLLTTDLIPAAAKLEVARILAGLGRPGAARGLAGVTVQDWIEARARTLEAQEVLAALVRLSTYADAPAELDAGATVAQLARATAGVLYLHGGWQVLVDALAAAARAAGARIEVGVRAQAVLGADRVEGVALADGAVRPASEVILAVPPRAAAMLLDGTEAADATAGALGVAGLGTGGGRPALTPEGVVARASCLDVALEGPLPRPRRFFGLGIDQPEYASVHTSVARLGPGPVIHVARYLAPDAAPASKDDLLALLERLQPGATERAVHIEYHPKMIVTHGLPRASAGGRRPGPYVPGLAGAYVAGDWVGAEGMLADAACASGDAAAQDILRSAAAEAA